MVDPIAVGTATPTLSWRLVADDERDVEQQWCQVEVRDEHGTVVWDSGRVSGFRPWLRYGGPPFGSGTVMVL